MRLLRIGGALPAIFIAMSCALGCQQVDDTPESIPCLWTESRPNRTFPVCTEVNTAEFMGTINGKPYDVKTSAIIAMLEPHPDATLGRISIKIGDTGALDLDWGDRYRRGDWMHINGGEMILPGDGEIRNVGGIDDYVLLSCTDYSFLFDIPSMYGGSLTGCAR